MAISGYTFDKNNMKPASPSNTMTGSNTPLMGPPKPTPNQITPIPQTQQPATTATPYPKQNENGIGIRNAFTNAGINDADIGWNESNGMVTYKGKDMLKPSSVVDGRSYADQSMINQALTGMYKQDNNPLVWAPEYFGQQTGVSNGVQWLGDGMISVGGTPIKATVMADGKAMIPTEVLNSAVAAYKNSTGLKSSQDIYDNWDKKYGSDTEAALDKILNRDEWSYDPNKDEAFLSYKNAYQREGERAFQDAIGNGMASTGGYMSSAAMTGAMQAQNYYSQQLNDRIPELMNNSYNRHLGEQQLNAQALQSLLDVSNSDYSKMYQLNRDTISDQNYANDTNYARNQDARRWNEDMIDRGYQRQLSQQEIYRGNITNKYYDDNERAALATQQLQNNSMSDENSYNIKARADTLARQRGYYLEEEAQLLGIGKDENGNYFKPNYADIMYAKDNWNEVEKPKVDYTYQKDAESYENQMATQDRYARSSTGTSSRGRSSGGSSGSGYSKTTAKEMNKVTADEKISDWLYSTRGLNGDTYKGFNKNTNLQYLAADKISDPEVVREIMQDLVASGYTQKQASAMVEQYKTDIASQIVQVEGRDYTDKDETNSVKLRYRW